MFAVRIMLSVPVEMNVAVVSVGIGIGGWTMADGGARGGGTICSDGQGCSLQVYLEAPFSPGQGEVQT